MKKISLKIKFSATMILSLLFCAGAIGLSTLSRASDAIGDLSYKYIRSASETAAATVGKFLESYWSITEASGEAMEVYDNLLPSNRRNYVNSVLKNLVMKHNDIQAAWCVWEPNALEDGEPGHFATRWFETISGAKVETLTNYNEPGEGDYYLLPKKSGATMILDPYFYMQEGKNILIISIATPIRSKKGTIVGVMGINIHYDKIQEVSQAVTPFPGAITGIWSNNGTIAGNFNPASRGKKTQDVDKEMYGPYLDESMKALKEGRPYQFSRFIPMLGTSLDLFFTPIKVGKSTSPWSFGMGIGTDAIMEPVQNMIRIAVIIIAAVTVLAVLVTLFFVNAIVNPIGKVISAIKNISEGEGDLTQRLNVNSGDEIEDLAFHFNNLIKVLRDPISQTKLAVDTLFSSSQDLSAVSQDLSSFSEEMVNQSTSVASTAEEMCVNMNSVATAMEEMSASIGQIARNAGKARMVAENAAVKSGEATDVMDKLSFAAKEIGKVTDVIKRIAEQTNLLALNATIEAATAGQFGKGFAVVAGEIKELASKSAKNADDIASRIEGIQSSTSEAVCVIHDVSEIIAQINQSVEAISGHVDQQTKASNEISSNASEAATGSTNVSQNVSGMKDAAHNSSQGASKINASVDDLASMANNLRGLMSRFKV
jgi:methyl-accepting chemotaxis protein